MSPVIGSSVISPFFGGVGRVSDVNHGAVTVERVNSSGMVRVLSLHDGDVKAVQKGMRINLLLSGEKRNFTVRAVPSDDSFLLDRDGERYRAVYSFNRWIVKKTNQI